MFEVGAYQQGQPISIWTIFQNSNNVYGKATSRQDNSAVKYLGTFADYATCWAACNNSLAIKGIVCNAFTWHQTNFGDPAWDGGCCASAAWRRRRRRRRRRREGAVLQGKHPCPGLTFTRGGWGGVQT
jgi:hypothetical protein